MNIDDGVQPVFDNVFHGIVANFEPLPEFYPYMTQCQCRLCVKAREND